MMFSFQRDARREDGLEVEQWGQLQPLWSTPTLDRGEGGLLEISLVELRGIIGTNFEADEISSVVVKNCSIILHHYELSHNETI